jgi:hypothetical protein
MEPADLLTQEVLDVRTDRMSHFLVDFELDKSICSLHCEDPGQWTSRRRSHAASKQPLNVNGSCPIEKPEMARHFFVPPSDLNR